MLFIAVTFLILLTVYLEVWFHNKQ